MQIATLKMPYFASFFIVFWAKEKPLKHCIFKGFITREPLGTRTRDNLIKSQIRKPAKPCE